MYKYICTKPVITMRNKCVYWKISKNNTMLLNNLYCNHFMVWADIYFR